MQRDGLLHHGAHIFTGIDIISTDQYFSRGEKGNFINNSRFRDLAFQYNTEVVEEMKKNKIRMVHGSKVE